VRRLNLLLRQRPWVIDLPLYFVLLPSFYVKPGGEPFWVQTIVYAFVVVPLVWRRRPPGRRRRDHPVGRVDPVLQ